MKHVLSIAALVSVSAAAGAVNLGLAGFSENFDSMGASGTAAPAGFSIKVGPSGTSNSTWSPGTGIPAAGVAALINSAGPLTASASYPTVTNNNGFNAPAYNAGGIVASNRAIALSPTTVSGAAIQLDLTNTTGSALNSVILSYNIHRYSVAASSNELPGYWLFVSLNGGSSWTEAANFRSTIATVPNTLGTSTVSDTLTFASAVANNGSILIRWVDDNAIQTSPDQIIGLDNVNIVIPTPGAIALAGLAAVAGLRRRR